MTLYYAVVIPYLDNYPMRRLPSWVSIVNVLCVHFLEHLIDQHKCFGISPL